MAVKKYSIKGWAFPRNKVFKIEGTQSDQIDLYEVVTEKNKIKVFLDQRRCHNNATKMYHQVYDSSCDDGFTVIEIFNLIVQTYLKSVKDVYDGEKIHIENVALHSFEFDTKTCSVYPLTDS